MQVFTWSVIAGLSTFLSMLSVAGVNPTSLQQQSGSAASTTVKQPRDAYVTLHYGELALGARVLAKSLLSTGTRKELVVLCAESVSSRTKGLLQQAGWTVKPVGEILNPYKGTSSRADYFSAVYTKLLAWNMTDYDRIVFLDSDTLVVRNIDHLFDCGTFCATFRHSDLFNSGVMVVEPSTAVFNDMLSKISSTPSYDEGDQGFLNIYFSNLSFAPTFNWKETGRQSQPKHLPFGVNGDVAMYYLVSAWKIPEEELRIIHYTMGPTKPWLWWANRLFELNWDWTEVRQQLTEDRDRVVLHELLAEPIFWAPYPLLMAFYFLLRYISRHCKWLIPRNSAAVFGFFNRWFSIFLPLPFVCFSYFLAFWFVVPPTMLPSQAEYIFWVWSNLFLLLFMSTYCYLCHSLTMTCDNQLQTAMRKKIQTLLLYSLFICSYLLLTLVPYIVTPFSSRIKAFFLLLVIHAMVSQLAGYQTIRVWTKAANSRTGSASLHQKSSSSLRNGNSYEHQGAV